MANIALTRKYSTMDAYWTDVQTFMTSAGWILHDDIDASNKVYKTNGSASNYPYIYLKLTKSTVQINLILYLYWNASTHVGSVNAYFSTSYNYVYYNSTYNMGLIGNADCVVLIQYTSYQGIIAGFCCDNLFYPELTTTSSGVSTGAYVDLPVVDSTDFTIGQHIQTVGINYEGRDSLIISDIQDSTHITVESLPRDYASGAFIGVSPCPAAASTASSTRNRLYSLCHRLAVGTANGTSSHYMEVGPPIAVGYLNPDLSTNFYGLTTPYLATHSSDSAVGWLDLAGMCKFCSSANYWDVFAVLDTGNQPEQGVATAVTNTTLTDTGKTWGVNALAGRYVVITEETGIGQSRKILSNTIDTLTVIAWDTNPSTISVYRICDKVYRYWSNSWAFLQDREVL